MRPGLPNTIFMDYKALSDFQPHHSPIPYGRESSMVSGIGDAPPRERHRLVMYQQESLAFGAVPPLCTERQFGFSTVQSPLKTGIPGVTNHIPDHWTMGFHNKGQEQVMEPQSPHRDQHEDLTLQDGRNTSTESDGDLRETPSAPIGEGLRPVCRTSHSSDRAKSAWRKLRLYLPDSSSSLPSPSGVEDSVFSELEDPSPPVAEVREVPEVTPAPGKVEQERWRFSATELISKLQLTQRRNNFTARIGKSLSTKITLRERGASAGQEGKSGRRERRCNSAGVTGLHQPATVDTDPSWLRNKLTDGAESSPARPPSQEAESGSHMRRSPTSHSDADQTDRRQSYCERRQSRFLLSSILYQEYSDVAINRELQRQKREDNTVEEDDVSASPKSNLSPSSSFRSQRSSRGSTFSLWQDIPDVRGSGLLNTLSIQERKLQEAKFELVTSEASYVNSLSIVVDHFLNSPELNECLGAQEKQWLFSKLPEVKEISERFLEDLEERLEEDILRFDVCDIVLLHCPELRRVYLPYVTNQAYQEQTYQRLLLDNTRFRGVLAKLEEDQVCQRLPLTSFLILPFQRIMRLKMLVENILKHTAPGSHNEETASQAFTELKKLVKECNSSVQSMKRTEELIHLNKKIHFESKIFPLISQSRWLVKHGELTELDMQIPNAAGSRFKLSPKPVYLHLFNDCLLLSRKKELGRFAVFAHAQVCDLKVTDLSWKLQEVPGEVFHVQLCHEQKPKHQILLRAQSESQKQRWISAMCPSNPLSDLENLTESEDAPQVQCIKAYTAQEHDELTLEKADILRLTAKTTDGWMEGIRLSDGERGWVPATHVEEITSKNARLRNLRENKRINHATSKLEMKPP
ncbi:rho guanine nucleotide exchange factor 19 isoform X1 [Ranitomeya imitator]|uniref:rho guanine nucleotide exchange factor 19 isoform X1 n=1 Tax=Ranitomeya imitator TaxID=111125 RepID=UPI0037E91206